MSTRFMTIYVARFCDRCFASLVPSFHRTFPSVFHIYERVFIRIFLLLCVLFSGIRMTLSPEIDIRHEDMSCLVFFSSLMLICYCHRSCCSCCKCFLVASENRSNSILNIGDPFIVVFFLFFFYHHAYWI